MALTAPDVFVLFAASCVLLFGRLLQASPGVTYRTSAERRKRVLPSLRMQPSRKSEEGMMRLSCADDQHAYGGPQHCSARFPGSAGMSGIRGQYGGIDACVKAVIWHVAPPRP
ncbi:hypothetical protein B0J12DRAFT_705302 [Macrophomina phaseolina]|uniref:Secreted protein n=1 Tax=Macrophomina phaseolina TaxID=35725 RepID=A0ABQ8FVF7_9PEZI|nr:hypothetical protein B0J12DRAFT_705302 [Macrophomina phaseolina]